MSQAPLQQFYIPEEQSIYLLSHHDARKLKDWVALCQAQLAQLGYSNIELIGKGAYGFVFAGSAWQQGVKTHYVFKFSRITLPTHLQERLEEEAFMLDQVSHPRPVDFGHGACPWLESGASVAQAGKAPTTIDRAHCRAAGGYSQSAAS